MRLVEPGEAIGMPRSPYLLEGRSLAVFVAGPRIELFDEHDLRLSALQPRIPQINGRVRTERQLLGRLGVLLVGCGGPQPPIPTLADCSGLRGRLGMLMDGRFFGG